MKEALLTRSEVLDTPEVLEAASALNALNEGNAAMPKMPEILKAPEKMSEVPGMLETLKILETLEILGLSEPSRSPRYQRFMVVSITRITGSNTHPAWQPTNRWRYWMWLPAKYCCITP
ncbi:hypothetical protein PVOR_26143 [Paenibacillus vortex V453]|uniref:Uncharacterized protein n=1 Tax=Paenibacillus vortex V453 TaxID=715225 RepID=A0A2R9SNZ8_9BACL|nr:hypothetical protein [Paenibacillus vortex]EFU39089.1 hypothetical protein PVOR_26143 [Paenibacillus vortex V453]